MSKFFKYNSSMRYVDAIEEKNNRLEECIKKITIELNDMKLKNIEIEKENEELSLLLIDKIDEDYNER